MNIQIYNTAFKSFCSPSTLDTNTFFPNSSINHRYSRNKTFYCAPYYTVSTAFKAVDTVKLLYKEDLENYQLPHDFKIKRLNPDDNDISDNQVKDLINRAVRRAVERMTKEPKMGKMLQSYASLLYEVDGQEKILSTHTRQFSNRLKISAEKGALIMALQENNPHLKALVILNNKIGIPRISEDAIAWFNFRHENPDFEIITYNFATKEAIIRKAKDFSELLGDDQKPLIHAKYTPNDWYTADTLPEFHIKKVNRTQAAELLKDKIDLKTIEKMLQSSRESLVSVLTKQYASYSGISHATTVLRKNGTLVTAHGLEHDWSEQNPCSERSALYKVSQEYDNKVVGLLHVSNYRGTEDEPACHPCRKAMLSTGGQDFLFMTYIPATGNLDIYTAGELLPYEPDALKKVLARL